MKILLVVIVLLAAIIITNRPSLPYYGETVLCRTANSKFEELAHFRTQSSYENCKEIRNRYIDYEKNKEDFICVNGNKCKIDKE
jgi:hypothetical protein